ncbi:uncharacterized protein BDZ99DRAFT_517439 [Mytilinidion resinicola]|uniref:Uncharacterized protein n=1 Tax=Mytilinidion resinicola TaxID=574789 RepID=A0A6A6YXK3_9PEZI|nr:uncharacterized protein BDZ99DRAFT_517439 [Mytilinidion resinicola]KAF2813153.1 hypothetical protein BDZ99DRAFT_517439 [Mytilinidion resinicola]
MLKLKNIVKCIATAFKAVPEHQPPRLETVEQAIKASAIAKTAKAQAKAAAKAQEDAAYEDWLDQIARIDPKNSSHQRYGPPW